MKTKIKVKKINSHKTKLSVRIGYLLLSSIFLLSFSKVRCVDDDIIKKKCTLIFIQGDLYYIDSIFNSEKDLSAFLESKEMILGKIVFKPAIPPKKFSVEKMSVFANKYYGCGEMDSSNLVKYINAEITFESMKMNIQDTLLEKHVYDGICIFNYIGTQVKFYSWKSRLNLHYLFLDARPLWLVPF